MIRAFFQSGGVWENELELLSDQPFFHININLNK